jgi:hypothetical protein
VALAKQSELALPTHHWRWHAPTYLIPPQINFSVLKTAFLAVKIFCVLSSLCLFLMIAILGGGATYLNAHA